MQEYDYIISGSGASGLMLAYRMANDAYFDNSSILIIDKEKKDTNDRTWCFWENDAGEWDQIVCKTWNRVLFDSHSFKDEIALTSYTYKMIRSADFYQKLWSVVTRKKNIYIVQDTVVTLKNKEDKVVVYTTNNEFETLKLINSIDFDKTYSKQSKFPVLLQHFRGWFIETEEDIFDDGVATFMDFTVKQHHNTRFMYVLPLTPKKALFEYTLFSDSVLSKEEYEQEIENYLEKKSIRNYKITEKEQGIIPMTSYKFWTHNSKNILNIGTIGGWTKASTGFTFKNTTKKTVEVIDFLKTQNDFTNFRKKTRFWWYDLLLLDVLSKHNQIGSKIFSKLFQRNSVKKVFAFLDEETSFIEDLRIMLSMPPLRFIVALFKRIFHIY